MKISLKLHFILIQYLQITLCSPEGANYPQPPSGGYNREVTPVPIPNTAVKLSRAENTWLVTTWEDKSPPD
jgi:hypothetical protein